MQKYDKSAATYYVLHQNPPHIIHEAGGMTYIVMLSGQTLFRLSNGIEVPCPGCPCPEKLPMANLLYFLHVNRKWIPFALGLVALLVLIHFSLMITDGGEMAAAFISAVSFWMNSTLLVLFSLTLVAVGIYNFKRGVIIEWGQKEEPLLLDPGTIDILPNVLVMSESEEEKPEAYRKRLDAAMSLSSKPWVVIIPFRQNFGVLVQSNYADDELSGKVFLRSAPIHDNGGTITHEHAKASANIYKAESWADYVGYCREFATRFKPWAEVEKMVSPKSNPIETVLSQMVVTLLLVAAMSVPSFAQKTKQVADYLGTYRYEKDVPEAGKEVSFIFKKRVLSRTADGKKTYAELLPASSFYTEQSDAGKLIGITVGGEVINPTNKPEKAAASANAESARPVDPVIEQGSRSIFESIPDSSALEQMKHVDRLEKAKQWQKVKPLLQYIMWKFYSVLMILFGLGGLFWMLAKTSAKDAITDVMGNMFLGNAINGMHIWSKTVLFFLLVIPTVVVMLNEAIWWYYTEAFGFVFVAKAVFFWYVWQWVFEKILPDSPSVRTPRRGNYQMNPNQLPG